MLNLIYRECFSNCNIEVVVSGSREELLHRLITLAAMQARARDSNALFCPLWG